MLKSTSRIKVLAYLLSVTFAYILFSNIYFQLKYNSNFPFFGRPLEFYIENLSTILFLIGLAQLFVSRFRKSFVLKIYLQYYIITVLLLLPFKIYWTYFSPNKNTEITTIFFTIVSYVIIALKAYALYILEKQSSPLLEIEDDGNIVFRPVNKWNRIFHYLLDISVYLLAIYSISSTYRYILFNTNFADNLFFGPLISASNTRFGAFIIASLFAIFYYLVLEVFFNTTIGKTLLGNIIVNHQGIRPSLAQRLGRTICRLIPFNALSFVFARRGWHDSITNTYVVKGSELSHPTDKI